MALVGTGFVLNRKLARHRMRVAEALKAAGFTVERPGGKTVWTRSGAVSGAVVIGGLPSLTHTPLIQSSGAGQWGSRPKA